MVNVNRKGSMMMRYFQLRGDIGSGAFNNGHHEDQLDELKKKVFQQPEIIEVILMHILQQNGNSIGGRLCTREARRLRLVSKTWLLEINFLFQRLGEPLIFLDGRNLRQFLEMCDIRKWGIPPISLSIETKALLSRNFCEDLKKFFRMGYLVAKVTRLGIAADPYALKEIQGQEICDSAVIYLPDLPPYFKLTNLRKIWLKQMEHSFTEVVEYERVTIPRLEEFVGQIVYQSEKLEEFKFEGEVWVECPPHQFGGLILPRTVTRVELDTRMNLTKILGIKDGVWRTLDGITVLKLKVTTLNLFGEGEMEGILEGVRRSLEYLVLDFRHEIFMMEEEGQVEVEVEEVVLKFPVLENLRRMKIGGTIWSPERSLVLNGLGDKFPRLEQLEFYDCTGGILLSDWCGKKSVFGGVTTLTLKLEEESMWESKMKRILNSFPKVEHLWLECVDVLDMKGVRYMFGELGGQLKSLHLDLRGLMNSEEKLEGFLIGGDEEMVKRLKGWSWWKGGGKMWKEFLEGGHGNGGYKSLRDLVNLEELVLVIYIRRYSVPNGWFWKLGRRLDPFCFDFGCELLFKAGFMRMPKLRRLELRGWLNPGKGLVEKWKRQGSRNGQMRDLEVEIIPSNCDRWKYIKKLMIQGSSNVLNLFLDSVRWKFARNWRFWVCDFVIGWILETILFWVYERLMEQNSSGGGTDAKKNNLAG